MQNQLCTPAVCHIWRIHSGTNMSESRLLQRIPECFIPHIRPPGLASSNLIFPHAEPSGDAAGDLSFDSREGGLKRTDSNLSSLLSSVDFTEDRERAVAYMEGNFQVRCCLSALFARAAAAWSVGTHLRRDTDVYPRLSTRLSCTFYRVCLIDLLYARSPGAAVGAVFADWHTPTVQGVPKNTWAVLAGDSIVEEIDLEEDLSEDASLCLVYSNHPRGELFANEPMLKSPFTDKFTTHVYNPGGGANLAGGNYPMMFADIKSSVMKATNGRQMPWTCIVPDDADKVRKLKINAASVGAQGSPIPLCAS